MWQMLTIWATPHLIWPIWPIWPIWSPPLSIWPIWKICKKKWPSWTPHFICKFIENIKIHKICNLKTFEIVAIWLLCMICKNLQNLLLLSSTTRALGRSRAQLGFLFRSHWRLYSHQTNGHSLQKNEYFAYCFAYCSILFDIFSIFRIFQCAKYAKYEPCIACTIFLHILLHILHIVK